MGFDCLKFLPQCGIIHNTTQVAQSAFDKFVKCFINICGTDGQRYSILVRCTTANIMSEGNNHLCDTPDGTVALYPEGL